MPSNKKLLIDWMPFNPSKNMIQEGTGNEPMKVKGVLQRAEAKNQNGRIYPKDVLKEEAQNYMKNKVKERRALGELDHPNCISMKDEPEALSPSGYKRLKDFEPGDPVLTMNLDTGKPEIRKVQNVVNEHYEGAMYHIKGRKIDVTVTPNHKFPMTPRKDRKQKPYWATAEELFENRNRHAKSRIMKECPGDWDQGGVVDFGFDFEPENFYKFLGIWLADGHTTSNKYEIGITQTKSDSSKKVKNLLDEMSINHRHHDERQYVWNDEEFKDFLRHNFGTNCYTKRIPPEFKNAPRHLLEVMLEWFVMGDGTDFTTGGGYSRKRFFSTSKRLADDMEEIALKCGHNGGRTIQKSKKDYEFAGHEIKAEDKKKLHKFEFSKTDGVGLDKRHVDIEKKQYEGKIECLSVPNSTFFVRDNSNNHFWSGNSEVVNLQNVSHNITSMEWNGNDLMGEVQVLSTPAGNILQDLFRNNVNVGISSRGLGSVKESADGTLIVDDDFELIAFDFVSNPSTHGAFMEPEKITESSDPRMIQETKEAKERQDVWAPVEKRVSEIIQEMNCDFKGQCNVEI